MKKVRAIIIFALLPLIAGYFVASSQAQRPKAANNLNFKPGNVLATDRITLTEKGDIISLTHKGVSSIPTHHAALIEAIPVDSNFIGVDKQTNYASLEEFSPTGSLLRTLQNGNTGNIDTMDWFTDPALSNNQEKLAFVSDKDKAKTDVQDNALFVENLTTGSLQKIADPDPHSGGIAHPVWHPTNPDLIAYDYYQYDEKYNPYSVIDEYNLQNQTTTHLTTREQNAYQGSFSPDGKQFLFLGRNATNNTTLYLATVTDTGLANIQSVATGDFAYPQFSNSPNQIYYLMAQGNSGYNLYTATLSKSKLTNHSAISTGEQLEANSGFTVSRK